MNNRSTFSPYLLSKNIRGQRRRGRLEDPSPISEWNFDSADMVRQDHLVAKRLLDGDEQGSYFHDSAKQDLAEKYSNNMNQIRGGRPSNTGVSSDNIPYRARLERNRN
jgi:hypothetical protein